MHGLLIAPPWLLALLEQDLSSLLWSCDIAVLIEPQKYMPLTGSIHYFDRSSIIKAPYAIKSRWEEQRRVHFIKKAAPDIGVPSRTWQMSALDASDKYWNPPTELMQAWSHWYCGSLHWKWEMSIIKPWLFLLSQSTWHYADAFNPLTRSPVWEGEELPAIEYYHKKWWFKGCAYDFCIIASGSDLIAHNMTPIRSIYWDGLQTTPEYRSGSRRIMRYALYQNIPLTLTHSNPGLFLLPLFWPVRLETLQEQWRILISLLYTHKGVLCF